MANDPIELGAKLEAVLARIETSERHLKERLDERYTSLEKLITEFIRDSHAKHEKLEVRVRYLEHDNTKLRGALETRASNQAFQDVESRFKVVWGALALIATTSGGAAVAAIWKLISAGQ